jgi:hypothetical protein
MQVEFIRLLSGFDSIGRFCVLANKESSFVLGFYKLCNSGFFVVNKKCWKIYAEFWLEFISLLATKISNEVS